jgi:hypothetical protein
MAFLFRETPGVELITVSYRLNESTIKRCLLQCWSEKTSSLWTAGNPARGQCGVTALAIHDRFGGEILKTRSSDGRWHFYNSIDGRRYDFTSDQFDTVPAYEDIMSSRDEAFLDTDKGQYRHLTSALKRSLAAAGSRIRLPHVS